MDAYLLDWVNLLLRFAHVITGIAWIGASFYFVFLDLSLTRPTDPVLQAKGVDGELWAVHGGGFYNPQKYLVAPKALPAHLHWFIWESYSTWLTGFALFTVLYLFNAEIFLIDKHVLDWSAGAAVAAALGFLVAGWLVYDAICRLFGARERGDLIVGVLVFVFVVVATWVACRLFAGRAAYLLVGAMLATAMSANVLVWIIPGQRKVIAQMRAGQSVDPVHGQRAKQRSLHNTYFTLPVLVSMISNHYGWLTQAPHNWLVLAVLMLAAALVRHSFVARHQALLQQRRVPWGYAIAGVAMTVAVTAALVPVPSATTAAAAPATMAAVKAIVDRRCVLCHNAQVQQKNVELDSAALIRQHAQAVYQQVVVLKLMPLGNATQITDDERALIKRWYEAGAKPD
ncbi:MAG: urate hydroxylase PuuD [Burkholderiaceae bacterium]|nr:urate hydroxylase PuuD [Burkholderiaceae bacterium]